tara:strand:+ start:4325 stop:4606 length:282 start_codon:yes stop_codon:yes gene_type:complete
MIIGDYQSFYNLIKSDSNQIAISLGECISGIGRICSCNKSRKSAKAQECNELYVQYVKNNQHTLAEYMRNKTNDAEIVFNHNSHHQILKLKLR